MMPQWVCELDAARASGHAGAMLLFNTCDRVFWGEGHERRLSGLPWFLAVHFSAHGLRPAAFELGTGFRELAPPEAVENRQQSPLHSLVGEENPLLLLRRLDPVLRDPNARVAVIFDHVEHVAGTGIGGAGEPASNEAAAVLETLFAWSHDDDIKHAGSFIVLIAREGEIHPLLRRSSGFHSVAIPLPTQDQRVAVADYLTDVRRAGRGHALGELAAGLNAAEFGRISGGLRLTDIEMLFRRAGSDDAVVDQAQVRERKRSTISELCQNVVDVIEPDRGFEAIAGCRVQREYFQSLAPAWTAGAASLPQGILLAGPPGGGKSFLVRALARELQSPCLALRGVREQWVGASERNMDRVLRVAESLAPCILWTDEIDQQLGGERAEGPSGDSGVNQRLFGRLLEFFGDATVRGRILWVATTNRPDLLDAAMRDRFSIRLAFLHPTPSERQALLAVLARQVHRTLAGSEQDFATIARHPSLDRLSVRALQEIVVWAGTLADLRSGRSSTPITPADLTRAVGDYRPLRDPAREELMALIAVRITTFDSLLPWMGLQGYRRGLGEWPPYLDDLVDPATGKLDTDALQWRIDELRSQRGYRALGR